MQKILVVVLIGVVCSSASCLVAFGDEPPGVQSKEPQSADQAWLKERQRLMRSAEQFLQQGRLDRAIELGEKALDLSYEHSKRPNADVKQTAEWFIEILESTLDFPALRRVQERYVKWNQDTYGADAWQTRNAKIQLQLTNDFSKLGDRELAQVLAAYEDDSRAAEMLQAGQPGKALPVAKRVLETRSRVLGPNHAVTGESYHMLAEISLDLDNEELAKQYATQASQVYKEVYGDEHPATASLLHLRAEIARDMGDFETSRQMVLRSIKLVRNTYGEASIEYAQTLVNGADVLTQFDKLQTSETMLLSALKIIEKDPQSDPSLRLHALTNLANIYQRSADYDKAEAFYQKALQFYRSRRLESSDAGRVINDYASFLQETGRLREAIGYLEQANALAAEQRGRTSLEYAVGLTNLATLRLDLGELGEAKRIADELRVLLRRIDDPRRDRLARCMDEVAAIYFQIGETDRAYELHQELVPIIEESFGTDSTRYADAMVRQANLYRSQTVGTPAFDYERLLEIYNRALAIYERDLGRDHPDCAATLVTLGDLHGDVQKFDLAKAAYLRAAELMRDQLGGLSVGYASAIAGLASVAVQQEDFDAAEEYYEKAMEITGKTLGENHPAYTDGQIHLAWFRIQQGDYVQAERLARSALEKTLNDLERSSYAMTAQQQLGMIRNGRYQLHGYLASCLKLGEVPAAGADVLIRWKGSVALRQRQIAAASRDPQFKEIADRLTSLVQQSSQLARARTATNDAEPLHERQRQLQEQRERVELELMRAGERAGLHTATVSAAQVSESLPDGATLLDFHQIYFDHQERILAVVFRKQQSVKVVDLGSAETAKDLIAQWRSTFGSGRQARQASLELRDQIWQPLATHLGASTTVFLSPDGVLANFPFAALPGSKPDRYLIEDYRLHYIPIPRLLPQLAAKSRSESYARTLLTVGGVDYDATPREIVAAAANVDSQPVAPKPLGAESSFLAANLPRPRRGASGDHRIGEGLRWNALVNTELECRFITELVKKVKAVPDQSTVHLGGAAASETAFRQLASDCRLIHIATHGFFEDQPDPAASLVESAVKNPRLLSSLDERREPVRIDPLQLSGLVFAGANQHKRGTDLDTTNGDDGILTAAEVATLPLGRVQLVTMSACETALGETEFGEGTLGLQRSFQLAGAKSTITTLWTVDDYATRVLMQHFYTLLLKENRPAVDALRETQLWALHNPDKVLSPDARQRGLTRISGGQSSSVRQLSPQFWAPFALSGGWQ